MNKNTSDKTYNGWTNYETWRVQLELVDDYVQNAEEEELREWCDLSTREVGNLLKAYVEEVLASNTTGEDGPFNVVLGFALSFVDRVNWNELAEHAQEHARAACAIKG